MFDDKQCDDILAGYTVRESKRLTLSVLLISTGVLMTKDIRNLMFFMVCTSVTGCADLITNQAASANGLQWDFDHQVQFMQTELEPHIYRLEVIRNTRVKFERLSSFLLRKSYRLCQGYHYQLEIIQGIEGFDDKRAMPNYIFPSLVAKVKCVSQLDKEKG